VCVYIYIYLSIVVYTNILGVGFFPKRKNFVSIINSSVFVYWSEVVGGVYVIHL